VLFSLIAIGAGAALKEIHKKMLFGALVVVICLVTIYFIGSTIYLNLSSSTKGPIHWHLDFQVWDCGEKLNLIDPVGMANKVGSSVFHEHNDNRIHIEGPVVKHSDINLRNFFAIVGGGFDYGMMDLPTNEGMVEMKDGEMCGEQVGKMQAFLFKVQNPKDHNNWVFTQEKLENAPEYVMSPESAILPGDCIVFEFGPEKDRTDHICESYEIAIARGVARGS
jgi:hypothetical protein